MPNHIKTIVSFDADMVESIDKMLESMKSDDQKSVFDFNKIIPMPEELRHNTSPSRIVSEDEYPAIHEKEMKDLLDEDKYVSLSITQGMSDELKRDFGADNWYEWSVQNWGTKWNAYRAEMFGTSLEFETAWSHPFPVMEQLSLKFPEITFYVRYADEDMGSNCGSYELQNGDRYSEDEYDNDDEGIRFACEVWGMDYSEDYDEFGKRRDEDEE